MARRVLNTSDKDWFKQLAQSYQKRESIILIDTAGVGIDPDHQSLMQMGLKAKMTTREITGALTAMGIGATGMALLIAAYVDPEPYSKLGLLIGSGAVLTLTGGMSAVWIFMRQKPPNVKVSGKEINITWN